MTFGVVMIAALLTIVVINMVDMLRYFVEKRIALAVIAEYYVYFSGWAIKSFTPMFVLLASLFSVTILARRQEVLAMKASGLSLYRLTWPIFAITIVIAAGHFYYSEYLFPEWNQRRVDMKEFVIRDRPRQSVTIVANVRRQIEPGSFYTLERFNTERREGQGFKLLTSPNNRLAKFIVAERLSYTDNRWLAWKGSVRSFSETDTTETYLAFDTLSVFEIDDRPADLARRISKPEDMGLVELQNYINLLNRVGAPYTRELVDLKLKYSFPVTSVIVILITVPFAANPRRGGVAASFAVGAGIALAYFVLFKISQSTGYNARIDPDLAAWGVNGLFLLVGSVLMLTARK